MSFVHNDHTIRRERVNVTIDGVQRSLPTLRPVGGYAMAQDTPQREALSIRLAHLADAAWEELRPGPVLAVCGDELVEVHTSWVHMDGDATVVGHIERRGRRRYGFLR